VSRGELHKIESRLLAIHVIPDVLMTVTLKTLRFANVDENQNVWKKQQINNIASLFRVKRDCKKCHISDRYKRIKNMRRLRIWFLGGKYPGISCQLHDAINIQIQISIITGIMYMQTIFIVIIFSRRMSLEEGYYLIANLIYDIILICDFKSDNCKIFLKIYI